MATLTPARPDTEETPKKAQPMSTTTKPTRRRKIAESGRTITKSPALMLLMLVYFIYTVVPLLYLMFSVTKTQADLRSTFGLWFGNDFALFDNIGETLTYQDGIFLKWFRNTLLYVVVGAGGATLLSTLGGYGLAKYNFPGKKGVFATVIGAVAVPGTALAVPTFLLFSKIGLANTPMAVILPSLISPFGLYLMWSYAREAIPTELLEAARVDGAGEFRIFFQIVLKLLAPGVVTVLLFAIVATWNNYFLPLIMLSNSDWFPLTVGLASWNAQTKGAGVQPIYHLVVTGALLTVIPIVITFLFLQRYWQSGLAAGSVKQ